MTFGYVYCLAQCKDGSFLLLDRNYSPWGMSWPRGLWADYSTCLGTRVTLTDSQIRQIEGGCTPYTPGDTKLWLYSDATRPEKGGALLAAYEARLALLGQFCEIDWTVAA